jgi:hypothetical protein
VPAGASHGSVPDGQPFYRGRMHYPTPGAPNDGRPAPIAVRINEWVAANSGPAGLADPADGNFEDWFELYNPGTEAVDLGGWYLSDNPASPFQFAIPANGHYRIPAGGFLLVWADGEPGQNSTNRADLHVSFSLRAAGEAIGLFAPDGSVVDLVTFTNQAENVSLGRSPDGGPSIVTLASPSPRSSNGGTGTIAPLLGPATAPSAGTIAFTIATQAGRTYQVEYTDQLGAGPWLPLGSARVANGPTLTITDATTGSAQRFYRVVTP